MRLPWAVGGPQAPDIAESEPASVLRAVLMQV